jgi:PAS domain S-box-containing protein
LTVRSQSRSRRRAPERLQEREEALHEVTSILQHVNIPSWIVDDEGIFVWVNDAYVELFGDRRGEHYSSTVSPEYLEQVERQFQRKLDGARAIDYEIEGLLLDGRRVRTEISAVRLDQTRFCGAVFGMAVAHPRPATSVQTRLTPRQLEVLRLLAAGASTDDIARELVVVRETVRNHIRQILFALRAHSRLEAVIKARREGLVTD